MTKSKSSFDMNEILKANNPRVKQFIPAKAKHQESIQNDSFYIESLANLLKQCEIQKKKYDEVGDKYRSAKLQVEIFEVMGKLRAHQIMLDDKIIHYQKVFLPDYEIRSKEALENWGVMYNEAGALVQTFNKDNLGPTEKLLYEAIQDCYAFLDNKENHDFIEDYIVETYFKIKRFYEKHQESTSIAKHS